MDNSEKELLKLNSEEHNKLMNTTKFQLDSDWEDYNQLNKALRYGHKETVKHLIQKGARVNKDPAVFNVYTPLHLAVNLGCSEIVKMLLDKGASINIKNNNHETPLIMAAKMRKDVITDLLLSAEGQQNCSNRENLSHMHIACKRNRVDVVKKLVQRGAQINHAVKLSSQCWPGYTPLHFAVQFQCIEIVQFLINCGADITAKDISKLTPLHFADMLRNEAIIDLILSVHKYKITNPVNSEGLSHFHIACTRNDPTVVESFIKQGVDINIKVLERSLNWTGYRPINFAIDYECADVVKLLLLHNANLNLCDIVRNPIQYAYKTANKVIIDLLLSKSAIKKQNTERIKKLSDLHIACIQKNLNEIEMAIQYGNLMNKPVDLNLPIWTGCTPLHLAIKSKCATTTELLCKYGADITIKDSRGKTPLHLAFETKQMHIVDFILSAHLNVKKNPTDDDGLSHFHISCMRNKLGAIRSFLHNGVDINSPVHLDSVFWPGYAPLHFATEFELKRVVELLLRNGADVAARNASGLTPLDIAIKCTDPRKCWRVEVEQAFAIIDLILASSSSSGLRNNGAESHYDDRGFTSLHVSCVNNDTEAVERILNSTSQPGSIDRPVNWTASDWLGYTPLHFAVHFGSKEAADLLLARAANVSARNAEGNTPLHTAFGLRHLLRDVESPGLIFSRENPVGDEGFSHFHIACSIGSLEAVRYFLELGLVDVNRPTKFTGVYEYTGQTALHLAVNNREVNEEVVRLLLSRGAEVDARDAELNTPLHCTRRNSGTRAAGILISHGADVNARNMYDETPLYSSFYNTVFDDPRVVPEKIRFLLEQGADVNLENEQGETPLVAIDSWPEHVLDKAGCTGVLMRHLQRLRLVGRWVSVRNRQDYYRLLAKCRAAGTHREIDFGKQCARELGQLARVSIDGYTTLRDVLFKRPDDMALHSENAEFEEIIGSRDFERSFPIYGFMVRLQFKRGQERRPLLEVAKAELRLLTGCPMPDACFERILQNLGDGDLRNIIASREKA